MEESKQAAPIEDPSTKVVVSSDIRYYACDGPKLAALQLEKPWMKDPKYFKNVAVSPSAIMKMMMHCSRGVEKGIGKGGNPIEVMGLLLGRPDPYHPTTLIITDAFPLPIEGFETRVIADDQDVVNHMINLNESLEMSRNEKFMGWYHSHPFDLGDHSHCFLSQTDLSTQLQWQRAEDPHGNPFVAVVLDPLRATHQGLPEIKAFRAFPPEYQSPINFECPDGNIEPSEKLRLEHWGSCWNRYYELGVEYYMSSTSRSVLEALTSKYLWISSLKTTVDPHETVQDLESCVAVARRALPGGGLGLSAGTGAMMATSTSVSRDAVMVDPEPARVPGDGAAAGSAMGKERSPLSLVVDKLSHIASRELAQTSMNHAQQRVFSAQE